MDREAAPSAFFTPFCKPSLPRDDIPTPSASARTLNSTRLNPYAARSARNRRSQLRRAKHEETLPAADKFRQVNEIAVGIFYSAGQAGGLRAIAGGMQGKPSKERRTGKEVKMARNA